jgi:hypothetical protein
MLACELGLKILHLKGSCLCGLLNLYIFEVNLVPNVGSEGRFRQMFRQNEGSDNFKISGPDRDPDCNILFSTFKIFFFGVKFSF